MKVNKKPNPQKVFDGFKNDLAELRKDVENGEFSKDEINQLSTELKGMELSLLQAKASAMLDSLTIEKPFLSSKMALMEILDILPVDVKKEHLSSITKFVLDNWNEQPQKLSA